MARYILVCGSWCGSSAWTAVAARLRAAGHEAATADLPSHGSDATPVSLASLGLAGSPATSAPRHAASALDGPRCEEPRNTGRWIWAGPKDLIIDPHNASGGEGLAGIGLTADTGRLLARPGPVAVTALLRDIALLILDVGRFRVACRDPVGRVAAGRFGVLAHVPVIARARAGRRGR